MTEGIENVLPGDDSVSDHGRKKRRYKYRFKKKRSKRKKFKKYLEYLLWVVVVAAFIISLYILIKQMELTDESIKKKRRKGSIINPVNSQQVCNLQSGSIISQNNLV